MRHAAVRPGDPTNASVGSVVSIHPYRAEREPAVRSMDTIPDIADTEQWVARTAARERDGRAAESALALLHPSDREPTVCPVLSWQAGEGCRSVAVRRAARPPYRQTSTAMAACDRLADGAAPAERPGTPGRRRA